MLDRIRSFSVITMLGFTVLLCIVQITLRYFTFENIRAFSWGDEIIKMVSVWVFFLAASIGVKHGAHLNVSYFLEKYLKPKQILIFTKCTTVIVIIALLLIIYHGIIHSIGVSASTLQTLPISMSWFYSAIPVGCAYLALEYTLLLIYSEHPFAK